MAESGKGCSAGDGEMESRMREHQAFSRHSDNRGNEEQQTISHFLVDRAGKGALDSLKNPSKVPV